MSGRVDAIDLSIFVSRWGSNDPDADLNNDGIVDAADLSILVSNWGEAVGGSEPEDTVYYLSPIGSDSNDGSEQSPVLSLQEINNRLEQNPPENNVRIIIASGRYYNQRVQWTYYSTNNYVRFEAEDVNNRPVFDGCTQSGVCGGGIFFTCRPANGEYTNLHFWYLRIENYQTAMSLGGRRGPYDHLNDQAHDEYSGGNTIYGVWFENIGNIFNPALSPSTAVIMLVNSRENLIQNNHFVNAINATSPHLIHAVYAAHHSSYNEIRNNRFEENSGDAIRVRDHSDFNSITGNTLINAGFYGYSDWFCDHTTRDDCTKYNGGDGYECPSWGNEFRNNLLGTQYNSTSNIGVFIYYQDYELSYECIPPGSETRRLRTSGNERI